MELAVDLRNDHTQGNLTAAHAQAFATFLTDLASGLHAKDKKLGVCVSDWGVDAPKVRYHGCLMSTAFE